MKVTKKMLADYIRRPGVEELTVGELLEFLRSQPDGGGETKGYESGVKKLERLKEELERYFRVPEREKMPAHLKKQFESDVLALYLNPNRMPLTMCYNHAKDIFNLRGKRYMFPTLGSIKRKLSSIPAEIISTARGER